MLQGLVGVHAKHRVEIEGSASPSPPDDAHATRLVTPEVYDPDVAVVRPQVKLYCRMELVEALRVRIRLDPPVRALIRGGYGRVLLQLLSENSLATEVSSSDRCEGNEHQVRCCYQPQNRHPRHPVRSPDNSKERQRAACHEGKQRHHDAKLG